MDKDEIEPGVWTSHAAVEAEPADDVLRDAAGSSPLDRDQELERLRAEIEGLSASIQEIAARSGRLANAQFNELKSSVEDTLKQNVFLSVGVAALIGLIWGRTRR